MTSSKKTRRSARRLFRLCLVDDRLDAAKARVVVERIAASKRRGALPILGEFQRLVRLDLERHTAIVESAAPLSIDVRDGVQSSLARTYGAGLTTSFTLNPSLIGGMRVKVGSSVFDGSVKGRLEALQARF